MVQSWRPVKDVVDLMFGKAYRKVGRLSNEELNGEWELGKT